MTFVRDGVEVTTFTCPKPSEDGYDQFVKALNDFGINQYNVIAEPFVVEGKALYWDEFVWQSKGTVYGEVVQVVKDGVAEQLPRLKVIPNHKDRPLRRERMMMLHEDVVAAFGRYGIKPDQS